MLAVGCWDLPSWVLLEWSTIGKSLQGEGSGEDLGYKLAGGWRQHLLAPFWKTVVHWPACAWRRGGGLSDGPSAPAMTGHTLSVGSTHSVHCFSG